MESISAEAGIRHPCLRLDQKRSTMAAIYQARSPPVPSCACWLRASQKSFSVALTLTELVSSFGESNEISDLTDRLVASRINAQLLVIGLVSIAIPRPIEQDSETSLPFCPFRKWADDQVGKIRLEKLWRIDSLARHLRTQHLQGQRTPFDCPYDGCPEVLRGAEYFTIHTERRQPFPGNF